MPQTILITGSSSGLGKATAKLFASRGWRVLATMRSPEKDTELASIPNIELLRLDTTDPDQIEQAVEAATSGGDVDVVFNNAGYGMAGPLEGMTDEQMHRMVNTNLMGTIRTTKAFLPYFRKRGRGLFINTTSIGGLIAVPFNSLYHATKWALEGWSESMAFELGQIGVGLKILEPGGMKTDFFTRSFDHGSHPAYDEAVEKVMNVITDPAQMATFSTPEQIAEIVYGAATDGTDQLRYVAGADAEAAYAARLQVGDQAFFEGMRTQFFGERPAAVMAEPMAPIPAH